jgi:hypothetical protein
MVHGPTLELHVLVVLEANLAIRHVSRGVVPGFSVPHPALGADIVPEEDVRLLGGHRHQTLLPTRVQGGIGLLDQTYIDHKIAHPSHV